MNAARMRAGDSATSSAAFQPAPSPSRWAVAAVASTPTSRQTASITTVT